MSCNEHLEPRTPFAVDPEALKVREWRHRLQKAFLNTNAAPKEDDMPSLDQLFTLVETYDNMRIEYLTMRFAPLPELPPPMLCWRRVPARFASPYHRVLCVCLAAWLISNHLPRRQFSKIGKVMRHIHALGDDTVPRDREFRFRARAGVLVDRWHDVLRAADGAPELTPAVDGARREDGPASADGELGDGAAETGAGDVTAVEVDADAEGGARLAAEEESADAESKPAPALIKIST